MIRAFILNFAVSAVVAAMPASAQFHYDDYKPSTLRDVFAIGEKECGGMEQNMVGIPTDKQAFRVEASWNGKTRQISQDMSALIKLYEEILRPKLTKQVSFHDMFKTEVLVTDNGREFWLPIQEQILEAFKKEVAPVKQVRLYVLYLGCAAKKPVPVAVAISEFQAAEAMRP